jgi:hypothetical protein
VAWKLIWTEDDAGVADGLATLDGSTHVIQDPANATDVPTANKIPKAMGTGKLAPGWIPTLPLSPHAGTHKNGGTDEVATDTPNPNAIPKADGAGKLDVGWLPTDTADGVAGLDSSKRAVTDGLVVAGTQVVGSQSTAIPDPSGGPTQDLPCRVAVNMILAALRGHGLIAT